MDLAGRRPPVATLLLTVVYASAIVVALSTSTEHALAGCLVLAGLTARWAVRRRSSTAAAMAASAVAVDAVLPDGGVLAAVPSTAEAPAAPA
jgi:hypothetical protein